LAIFVTALTLIATLEIPVLYNEKTMVRTSQVTAMVIQNTSNYMKYSGTFLGPYRSIPGT